MFRSKNSKQEVCKQEESKQQEQLWGLVSPITYFAGKAKCIIKSTDGAVREVIFSQENFDNYWNYFSNQSTRALVYKSYYDCAGKERFSVRSSRGNTVMFCEEPNPSGAGTDFDARVKAKVTA